MVVGMTMLGLKSLPPHRGQVDGERIRLPYNASTLFSLDNSRTLSSFAKRVLPFVVNRYFCLLLLGLPGKVISNQPDSSRGFSTWFLNLVGSLLSVSGISSDIAFSDKQLWRIPTWCRPGAGLP